MKKEIILLVLFPSFLSYAQKQGNIWYFGNGSGISFNSGVPVSLTGGQTGTDNGPGWVQEGTACISDSSGALLFYSGGATIWNFFHHVMPNGTGINGGISSTQAALILPKPGNDSLFYLFTSDQFQNLPSGKGYRYSLVNMCLDSAKGDIVVSEKNVLLMDSCTEKLAACRDASANGYWILGHKMYSNEFRAWHLTSSGITATVTSKIGTVHGFKASNQSWISPSALGQMKFNPQSTRIAVAIGNFDPAYLDLFNFNNATGVVSNPCHFVLDSALGKRVYGVEFSPDGTKLYAGGVGGSGGKRL